MKTDWPFDDRNDVGVITLRQIVEGAQLIRHVCHDEDGCWQFLGCEAITEADAIVVSLLHVVQLDPTVKLLADLPAGWQAWRVNSGDEWKRSPGPVANGSNEGDDAVDI